MNKLNKAEWTAIDTLGSHCNTGIEVGIRKPISTRTFNHLYKLGLAMWVCKIQKAATLTRSGEQIWKQRNKKL